MRHLGSKLYSWLKEKLQDKKVAGDEGIKRRLESPSLETKNEAFES